MYNLRIKRQKIATVSRAMVKDIFIKVKTHTQKNNRKKVILQVDTLVLILLFFSSIE
jgi:Na+/pantothenate symporter